MIPEILNEKDPSRSYHPSSPLNGWGRKESMTQGDSHYWGVWWGDQDFEVFNEKVPRFMSEYGFQGFPDSLTLLSFGAPYAELWSSDVLNNHEKHPRGFELITHALLRNYKEPAGFAQYAELSRIIQCDAMQTAIEAQRRAQPYCMGTLYWQFNDCWPVISWSTRSYSGAWKPAQYVVKRLYRTVMLSAVNENDSLRFYGVSDSLCNLNGQLKIKICSNQGTMLWSVSRDMNIKAQSSSALYAISLNDLRQKYDSTSSFVYAEMEADGSTLATTTHFFCRPGNYVQPAPELEVIAHADSLRQSFTMRTNCLLYTSPSPRDRTRSRMPSSA
jgi:beta-mannosidase